MNKIDNFLINHTSSFVCFLFAFLVLFFLIFLPFDFYNQNKIINSELNEINYIEGEVIRVQPPKGKKTNYDFLINDCDKEFYIHAKYVREYNFKEGDYIKIYYADNLWIRGSYHEIVNFEHNGKLIFSLEQYKEEFIPEVYILGITGTIVAFITFSFPKVFIAFWALSDILKIGSSTLGHTACFATIISPIENTPFLFFIIYKSN